MEIFFVVDGQNIGGVGVSLGRSRWIRANLCPERVCEQNIAKMGLKVAGEGWGIGAGPIGGRNISSRAHLPNLEQKKFSVKVVRHTE
jgi:hypothetical protein